MSSPSPRHYDVLILGGGFAGVYCAQRLVKRLEGTGKSVGVIARENHMVFQPMLPEVVGGSLAPRHVVNPIRLICDGADVFRGLVKLVNLPGKRLLLDGGVTAGTVEFTFDHIVFALGAEVDLTRIPGMSEHAYLVRNCGDAMKLRATIIGRMEEANLISDAATRRHLLSFIVVGGGYSGVETAGQMIDLLHSMCRFYEQVQPEDFSVTLVHSGEKVLPMLSAKLADYTSTQLQNMGVKILFKARVKAATARTVILDDGRKIDAYTVVCTVGNAPHPQILALGASGDLPLEKGHVVVEATGQVKGCTHVWAAGDCASFPKAGGGKCPETAQFAYRQGLLVGDNIAACLQGRSLAPFAFTGLGELASIGHRKAVAEIFGWHFSGIIAWFMWRTIYLMKLPGLDRKLRVMSEWTFDLFFPRDINLLTPQYSSPMEEMHLEAGDPLFHKGEPAFSFYAVKNGRVDITDESGEVVKSALAGDHFGERALLEDHIWRYTATAKEPSTLVAIDERTFQKLVSSIGSLSTLFRRTAETYDSAQEIEHVMAKLPQRARSGTAGDLMVRQLASLNEEDRLDKALDLFHRERHSTYPVLDAEGRVRGLLRRADCYEWLKHHAMDPGTLVKDLPIKRAMVIATHMPLPEVFELMIRTGASKAVVCDADQKLVGMLTLFDLLTAPTEAAPSPEELAAVPAM
ncbi:FAD-dependent oxidoreductase [Verrucomicrobium spinosum]|uniref:FAD-dependent oxidoreductase n=2 Tax=Verrucomicrobium spinosum TaxID=2736 RepID=UPI0009D76DEE|nr:FAD-dependent oxidoreductase [Verrucomicrobium spinosum]